MARLNDVAAAIEQFKAATRAGGREPPDVIDPGKLHRFPTNGKRGDDAGWYKLFADLRGGVFGGHHAFGLGLPVFRTPAAMIAGEREAFQRMVASRGSLRRSILGSPIGSERLGRKWGALR